MKILHLWKSEGAPGGGGGISMFRLHLELKKSGIDSKILCQKKTSGSAEVFTLPKESKIDNILDKIAYRFGLSDIHQTSSFKIPNLQIFKDADIIHFHGIHNGFINYLALPKLTKHKPALFTLNDIWMLTGHCAVQYDCFKWKSGCGKCPYLSAPPAIKKDSTKLQWKLKKYIYQKSNLTIIGVSSWITELAKQSTLKHFNILHLNPGINTEAYKPLERKLCRQILRIPPDKKVLMLASIGLSQFHKGPDLLVKALNSLPQHIQDQSIILLLGHAGESITEKINIPAIDLGYISGDHLKSVAYSAADIFLHPSRAETLGNVMHESIACGTPVIAFHIGGIPDLVKPEQTGYLAEPENTDDFADKIRHLIENDSLRNSLRAKCRKFAIDNLSSEKQTRLYIELYNKILKEHKK